MQFKQTIIAVFEKITNFEFGDSVTGHYFLSQNVH